MGKVIVFLGSAVLGAILGSAAALLLTQQSGEELRLDARQRYQDALAAGRKASEERKRQLIAEYEAMKRGEVTIFPKE